VPRHGAVHRWCDVTPTWRSNDSGLVARCPKRAISCTALPRRSNPALAEAIQKSPTWSGWNRLARRSAPEGDNPRLSRTAYQTLVGDGGIDPQRRQRQRAALAPRPVWTRGRCWCSTECLRAWNNNTEPPRFLSCRSGNTRPLRCLRCSHQLRQRRPVIGCCAESTRRTARRCNRARHQWIHRSLEPRQPTRSRPCRRLGAAEGRKSKVVHYGLIHTQDQPNPAIITDRPKPNELVDRSRFSSFEPALSWIRSPCSRIGTYQRALQLRLHPNLRRHPTPRWLIWMW